MAKKKTNLGKVKVLLGVSGGVAAYKAVDLASKLTGAGAKVQTVMTKNTCELVQPKSFEAVTCSPVFTDLWTSCREYEIGHIALVDWADVIVVAPATANIIGKLANGICDDLLSTVLCACWNKRILIAPAMNENMWNNPAVAWNAKTITEMGIATIGPVKGRLACGSEGVGRLAEADDIIEAITKITSKRKTKK